MENASPACNAESLRVHLLGAFCVERGTKQIHFPTRKVESLFAFLVLHPEPHSREKLATLLWGDSTDEQARHSLRTALATIRKELGDDILLADRESVQLNSDVQIWGDALQVSGSRSQVSAANELIVENYAGDLLPAYYDEWILPEREHLRTIYLDALLQLAQTHRAKSEYARAIEYAQKILASDPANEKACQHIIFCLAATGDRIGALKQFDECAKKLRDELGVEPSKETIALRDQIEQALTGTKSRAALFTNLPTPLTSFIGREKELAELRGLIGNTRLLTLTGAGGCGKTRLAIQVATELANASQFKQGVWWVDLAALQDSAQVAQSVATVFDLHDAESLPLVSLLTNFLRAKDLLLILDNCEQVIDACAQFVGALLPACPQLRVLATSRERLNVAGEFVWYVPSLALPPTTLPLEQLRQYDAIQLFTERARAIAPHWSLVGHGATVTHICAQLDGIPLALELAASRLNVLSVEQIDARLSDRFNLLTGKNRTELPRHQTLRATMDWSYDLLSDAERAIFRQFGVFVGGWTLEAAETIIAPDALDYLTALADKSLVVVEQAEQGMRYRLLETIRQYAREKLEASSELQPTQERHLAYFLNLVEQARPHLLNGDPNWLNRIEIEYGNMCAALEHALATNAEMALRISFGLEWFWTWHNRVKEGYDWTRRILSLTEAWGPGKLRARALYLAGSLAADVPDREKELAYTQASLEMARAEGDKHIVAWSLYSFAVMALRTSDWSKMRLYAEESRVLFEELGISWGVFNTNWQLGSAAYDQGDYDQARWFYEQALAWSRKNNIPIGIAWSLYSLGDLARRRGDYVCAKAMHTESTQIIREMGHKIKLATSLRSLGQVALHDNEPAQAKKYFEESLAICQLLERKFGQTACLAGFAGVAGITGKSKLAAQLFGATKAAFETIHSELGSLARSEIEPIIERVRQQLDQELFDGAWQGGRKMTLDQAIEYALENL